MKIGIAGAGVMGRVLAWRLCQAGFEVHLYDKNPTSKTSCSYIAGGMISPLAESIHLGKKGYHEGMRSLSLWSTLIQGFSKKISFNERGTLVVTTSAQRRSMTHYIDCLAMPVPLLEQNSLKEFEPEMPAWVGCYLPNEAVINPMEFMQTIDKELKSHDVHCTQAKINHISKTQLFTEQDILKFDQTIDCLGLGSTLHPTLRPVRGEIVICEAKHVAISRPVRILNERFPCYIIPRENHIYTIGATEIETSDDNPMTVRSALMLLSAAASLHSGFYEANILEMRVGMRPTSSGIFPFVKEIEGVVCVNGLSRHGYLYAPFLAEQVLSRLQNEYTLQ